MPADEMLTDDEFIAIVSQSASYVRPSMSGDRTRITLVATRTLPDIAGQAFVEMTTGLPLNTVILDRPDGTRLESVDWCGTVPPFDSFPLGSPSPAKRTFHLTLRSFFDHTITMRLAPDAPTTAVVGAPPDLPSDPGAAAVSMEFASYLQARAGRRGWRESLEDGGGVSGDLPAILHAAALLADSPRLSPDALRATGTVSRALVGMRGRRSADVPWGNGNGLDDPEPQPDFSLGRIIEIEAGAVPYIVVELLSVAGDGSARFPCPTVAEAELQLDLLGDRVPIREHVVLRRSHELVAQPIPGR